MEKKGQWYLLGGVIAAIGSMLLTWNIIPEGESSDFFGGVLTGVSLVFMIHGLVLIVRSKMKKK